MGIRKRVSSSNFYVRKHLNTPQILKLTHRQTHGHLAQLEIPRQLHNVYMYVYTMLSDKFTPYYKTSLHNIRGHV